MRVPANLCCPNHISDPVPGVSVDTFAASSISFSCGCAYEIIRDIPRFVPNDSYASRFGWQWKRFSKTQLDSYTETSISKDRLHRVLGMDLAALRGLDVMDAGAGAGRFSEVMLEHGARVVALDLSAAVEANFENNHRFPNFFVCQADILNPPVKPGTCDVVICVGVVQHTPVPEYTIGALARIVKPGGLLAFDHYTIGYDQNFSKRILRWFHNYCPTIFCSSFIIRLTKIGLIIHRIFWRPGRIYRRIRSTLNACSFVVDYFDAYPQLGVDRLSEWALLDTHDTLTDRYKHLRTIDAIRNAIVNAGLEVVSVKFGGNGVEALARKAADATRAR